jgi:hypothetical protein
MARKYDKAETISAREGNTVKMIRDMTGGYETVVCVDAVGMEADPNFAKKALELVQIEE